MRKEVRRRHDAHVRALAVCTEHSAFFEGAGGQKTLAAYGAQVAEVDRQLAFQERSIEDRRGATEQCRQSRRALRDAAKAVVRVGRLVDLDAPSMATMRLPGPISDDQLLAYSRGLLERVSTLADAFVAAGLPSDLLKQFGDAIEAFAAAREAQAMARQHFKGASESISDTLDAADKAVDVLEAIVINKGGGSPEILPKLRMARRVGPRANASPPKPSPSPAPSPTPSDKAA